MNDQDVVDFLLERANDPQSGITDGVARLVAKKLAVKIVPSNDPIIMPKEEFKIPDLAYTLGLAVIVLGMALGDYL